VLTHGLIAAGAALALTLTGCSSSGSGSSAGSGGSAATGKKLTIGYVSYSLATAPQQGLVTGQTEEAKKYGYSIKTADSQASSASANSLMQTFVTQKVDAIHVDSYSPDVLQAGIQAAKSARIPVYLSMSDGTPTDVASIVRANAGTAESEQLVQDLGTTGDVLAFTLPSGSNCVSSENQFDTVMAKTPGIKITKHPVAVPGFESDAASVTKAWLRNHPAGTPLAVWSCWDGPALGAASALIESNRLDVKDYGQNTEAKTVDLLEKKQFTASWYIDAVALGREIVDQVHGNADKNYSDIKGVFSSFAVIPVNQANVTEFAAKYPQVLKGS
jgi:ribose transport system substrate-binding protein